MPLDVMYALDGVFDNHYDPPEKVQWKHLETLAKNAFSPHLKWIRSLQECKWPRIFRIAVFGGFLGKEMGNWSEAPSVVITWWTSFLEKSKTTTLLQSYYRAAFASCFQWTFDDRGAYAKLEALSRVMNALSNQQHMDFGSLQQQALKRAQQNAVEAGRTWPQELTPSPQQVRPDPVPTAALHVQPTSQPSCANTEVAVASKPKLTEDQLATIEKNRRMALERKRLRQESNVQETSTPDVVSGPVAVARDEVLRSVATPMHVELAQAAAPIHVEQAQAAASSSSAIDAGRGLSIREVESISDGRPVSGTVKFRCDHKTGGGFHVRIGDSTGEIDVTFWKTAADSFRAHPALQKGGIVRLKGFRLHKLVEKALQYAPFGRSHQLTFNCSTAVHIEEVLRAPEPQVASARRDLNLNEALSQPDRSRVTIEAWAVEVEDVVEKSTREGAVSFRVVWLALNLGEAALRVRWSVWRDNAKSYGPKQLLRQHVRLRGVQIKAFAGRKELSGCWQEGGIEVLPP